MLESIKKALTEYAFVENICALDGTIFRGISYEGLFECDVVLEDFKHIELVVGIPSNWQMELIDIYVVNFKEIVFMPHIDNKGKICLFETEGILIDWNLNGIICQSLLRAKSLLQEGILGKNKAEFIKEFESYWGQLPEARVAYFTVPMGEDDYKIKFSFENVKRRRKEKNREYQKRLNASRLYIGKDVENIEGWNLDNTTIMNAAYFVLQAKNDIFPPDIREALSIDYLNDLLKLLPYKDVAKAISRLKRHKVIIFAIKQPIGVVNYIGFYLNGGNLQESSESCLLNNVDKIQPLVISRIDKGYLLKRTLEISTEVVKKKILVIGCGSIGGYLICEIARAGYEDITLVDNDFLREENIFRHILGMEYISKYKCVALENYIRKNIPEVSIKTLPEKFENAVLEEDLELADFDLIIAATGNQNLNRWINAFVMKNQIETPVIYAWNEVYGIGNHVAYFKYGNEGCYECIFGRNEITGEIYNKSSYCDPGQNVTKTVGSCGETYIPYGNVISMKTVVICLDLIKAVFENRIQENVLISTKGDDGYFIMQGLTTSGRYKNQKEEVKKITGDKLANKSCGVCNGNIGKR